MRFIIKNIGNNYRIIHAYQDFLYLDLTIKNFCVYTTDGKEQVYPWDSITELACYPNEQFFFPFDDAIIKQLQQYYKNVKVYDHAHND